MAKSARYQLTSTRPAAIWQDAMPSGNGTMGALVFGQIERERAILNHEQLFFPISGKHPLPKMSRYLPHARELIRQGRYDDAQEFWKEKFAASGIPRWPDPFQPALDLLVRMPPCESPQDYVRGVDLETGEVTVQWTDDGIALERALFVSRGDHVVAMRIRGSRPEMVSAELRFAPTGGENETVWTGQPVSALLRFEAAADGQWLTFRGCYHNGEAYGAVGRVVGRGGVLRLSDDGKGVAVEAADEVLVLVRLYPARGSGRVGGEIKEELQALPADYERLLERHKAIHRELFLRMTFDLDVGEEERRKTNEELLAEGAEGPAAPVLVEKLFHYGRYLLISSTGRLPANLQGVWNGSWEPPWYCDYTLDENIQMAYWQALGGNLAELMFPYFEFFESQYEDWRRNATLLLGCRGVQAPLKSTTHGLSYLYNFWPSGAGWLAQPFYDYWLFSADRTFLAGRAVPLLKEIALFYEDFLVEGEDGELMFIPSISPENRPAGSRSGISVNATMDVAVAREVLRNLIAACEVLGVEEENIPKWEDLLRRLPRYQVNEDGALREWLGPGLADNYRHRHQSHLYPLFPGFEVTEESSAELFEACRAAADKRRTVGLDSQTGWSLMHMANVYARLGRGQEALECMEILCRKHLGPNFLTYHNRVENTPESRKAGLFQIDASLGFTAAVQEMLLYSRPGMIKILPALPDSWKRGRAAGMCCRGRAQVAMAWDLAEGWVKVGLLAAESRVATVKFPWAVGELRCTMPEAVGDSGYGECYRSVKLPAGARLGLTVFRQR